MFNYRDEYRKYKIANLFGEKVKNFNEKFLKIYFYINKKISKISYCKKYDNGVYDIYTDENDIIFRFIVLNSGNIRKIYYQKEMFDTINSIAKYNDGGTYIFTDIIYSHTKSGLLDNVYGMLSDEMEKERGVECSFKKLKNISSSFWMVDINDYQDKNKE